MGPKKAARIFPQLHIRHPPDSTTSTSSSSTTNFIKYVGVFYEGMHNDACTCLAIAMTAAEHGAVMCNYVEAIDLIEDERNVVVGAIVRDRMSGKEFPIYVKKVVLAGGPFTDQLRAMETAANSSSPTVRGAAGTHLVLRGNILPANMGLLDYNTSNSRFLFVLPWLRHTLVGTTDDATVAPQT
jgi:glycerol-3-phosphate dehydrogenase